MLIKVYDKNMNYLRITSDYKDLCIIQELETGYKTAQLSLPYSLLIQEEQKLEIDGYLYVVKELDMEDPGLYSIYCKPYFGSLAGKHIESLNGTGMTLQSIMTKIVSGTDWTWGVDRELNTALQLDLEHLTAIEAIRTIADLARADVYFDTKEKIVYLMDKDTRIVNTFIANPANMYKCKVQSHTYDLITRLIPLGKDELDIRGVNGGRAWIENHDYTDEVIVGYYVNEDVENALDLFKVAQAKLYDLSVPRTTYRIALSEMPKEISVGDKVRIMDKFRGINDLKKISKLVVYPASPQDSYVELGEEIVAFDKIYRDFESVQNRLQISGLKKPEVVQVPVEDNSGEEEEETT